MPETAFKIALLGDVHANLPALEAVLAHARLQGAAAIWNVGDFLGYGAFPNEVVQRLRQDGALSILGNYDIKVLRFKARKKKWRNSKLPEKYLAFQWAHKSLSIENRRYLKALPEERRLELAGRRVLITHGSPVSNEEHLLPDTPEARLRELAGMAQAEIIVCGHSHQPFVREVEGVVFINTGSVGRPDDGDPRSCYALLEVDQGVFNVQHFRLEYDIARAVTALRERGLPEAFTQMIEQGYDLDTILNNSAP
jgi:putative phosphoesterase